MCRGVTVSICFGMPVFAFQPIPKEHIVMDLLNHRLQIALACETRYAFSYSSWTISLSQTYMRHIV